MVIADVYLDSNEKKRVGSSSGSNEDDEGAASAAVVPWPPPAARSAFLLLPRHRMWFSAFVLHLCGGVSYRWSSQREQRALAISTLWGYQHSASASSTGLKSLPWVRRLLFALVLSSTFYSLFRFRGFGFGRGGSSGGRAAAARRLKGALSSSASSSSSSSMSLPFPLPPRLKR